jgi:nitroreductase
VDCSLWSAAVDLRTSIQSRKMVRSFSDAPLSRETLDSLLELAIRAPSAGNAGGREFVVLEGSDTARYWDTVTTESWRTTSRRWTGFRRAPVVVVVIVSPERYMERYDSPDKASSGLGSGAGEEAWPVPYWFFDAGMSVMALLLGATNAGLGACLLGNFRGEDPLLEALGVPDSWRFAGAVLIGTPGGDDPLSESTARGRPQLSEIVHRGTWRGSDRSR